MARSPRATKGRAAEPVRRLRSLGPIQSVVALSGHQAAIGRAKLEWESTADALAALVCMLGSDGKVIRANRVVEDWALGTVGGVLGTGAHTLLHPQCTNGRCALARFLTDSLAKVRRGATRQFELQHVIGTRFLQLTIRPMRRRSGAGAQRGGPRAVLVATDQSALHRAQDALERLNASLESRVRTRTQALADANRGLRKEIVRREQAEVALRSSRNELMALSEQLIGAQEGERKRIAVELHDSVGQSLSAVKYTLERGVEMLRQPKLGDPAAVLQLAVQRIQETAENIRSISTHLRPRILDDLGAASAAQWFCRNFSETYPALVVVARVKVADGQVPDRLATVVYRGLQELLNNVAKHSKAQRVQINLALEDRELSLQVRDDGIGPEMATAESRRDGSGLRNLRERAQMTGGQFSVTRAPGRGTLAQLSWQLGDSELPHAAAGARGQIRRPAPSKRRRRNSHGKADAK
jgi:signal transduction histidine kinase